MQPFPYDLFGEVPVTTADIELWLRAVPHIDPESPRAAWYVTGWNVPDKIRQAKLSGRFDALRLPRLVDNPTRWI